MGLGPLLEGAFGVSRLGSVLSFKRHPLRPLRCESNVEAVKITAKPFSRGEGGPPKGVGRGIRAATERFEVT